MDEGGGGKAEILTPDADLLRPQGLETLLAGEIEVKQVDKLHGTAG